MTFVESVVPFLNAGGGDLVILGVEPNGGRFVFRNCTAKGFPTVLLLWTIGDDEDDGRGGVVGVEDFGGKLCFAFDPTDGDALLVDGAASSCILGNRFDCVRAAALTPGDDESLFNPEMRSRTDDVDDGGGVAVEDCVGTTPLLII